MSKEIIIITFYRFIKLCGIQTLQSELLKFCQDVGMRGTILLAEEGINATLAGSDVAIHDFKQFLESYHEFQAMRYTSSSADEMPFLRLKVKLKKEIVKIGLQSVEPVKQVGEYVAPEDWNAIISDPDTLVIDTRNDYEVELGTFQGAKSPNTATFCEFPSYVAEVLKQTDKKTKVAMFCTGGIRCEKASSFMLSQGFETVYHLKGGILNYFDKIPKQQSLWQGECFVFDDRVSVDHAMKKGCFQVCANCDAIVSPSMRESTRYEEGVCCPQCFHDVYPEVTEHEAMG